MPPAPTSSTGSSSSRVTAGRVAAPVQRQARARGPGFVDIDRLLNANRVGAQRMADNLIGSVRREGDTALQGINSAQSTFSTGVQQGTVNYDPTKANTSAEASTLAGQTFKGPNSWEAAGINTGQLAQQAARAQDKAQNLKTDYGRAALLREQVGGPYSAGSATLDSVLAGAAGGNALRQTADSYAGLSQRLLDARGASTATVDAARKQSEGAATKYRERAGALKGEEDAKAAAEVAAREAAEREEQERQRREMEARQRGNFEEFRGAPPRFSQPPRNYGPAQGRG